MCLLSFLPPDQAPDPDALRHGAATNADGHGFALITDGRLLVGHGLDAEAMIDAFAAARAHHPHGPALFHSRQATHGPVSRANCHPVYLGAGKRTVVAHNGILPRTVQPTRRDARSDTRILAQRAPGMFGPLYTRRARRRLERWIGPDNKIVILTVDARFTRHAYLLNEHAGIWDGGIWYSNTGYLPAAPHGDAVGGDDRCWQCGAALPATDLVCPLCGYCLDCGQSEWDCLCHPPAWQHCAAWPGHAVLGQTR